MQRGNSPPGDVSVRRAVTGTGEAERAEREVVGETRTAGTPAGAALVARMLGKPHPPAKEQQPMAKQQPEEGQQRDLDDEDCYAVDAGEWWAFGRDLASSSLISTRPLRGRRRPVAATMPREPGPSTTTTTTTAAASTTPAVIVGAVPGTVQRISASMTSSERGDVRATSAVNVDAGSSAGAPETVPVVEPEGMLGASGQRVDPGVVGVGLEAEQGAGEGKRQGGKEWRRGNDPTRRRGRPRASIDRSRQRVLDLETFIPELLRHPEAFPRCTSIGGAAKNASAARENGAGGAGAGGLDAGYGGSREEGIRRCPRAIATDYHCVTVGLMEGGRRVRSCVSVTDGVIECTSVSCVTRERHSPIYKSVRVSVCIFCVTMNDGTSIHGVTSDSFQAAVSNKERIVQLTFGDSLSRCTE